MNLHVQISWQPQHFVNLHVQMSWQAQHFVNLHAQISRQAQRFVNLHVQISWQAQHFVNFHAQISWQAQQFDCEPRGADFVAGTTLSVRLQSCPLDSVLNLHSFMLPCVANASVGLSWSKGIPTPYLYKTGGGTCLNVSYIFQGFLGGEGGGLKNVAYI